MNFQPQPGHSQHDNWWKRRSQQFWREGAWVQLSPTSRGTWTIRAKAGDKYRSWTGIDSEFDFQATFWDARRWMTDEIPDA